MNGLIKAVMVAGCALAFTATTSSAAIVCNEDGDCWRVKKRYKYRPDFGLRIYPDSWKWADRENTRYRWREDRGRGYWRKGVWVEF
jgi:hypothetical protein